MNKELVFKILEELIKIDTTNPPGNEKNAVEYLQQLFLEYDIYTEVQNLGNNRANLIASYGVAEPEIIFCGHLDVVPSTEEWTYPPFQATWQGTRLYGRGTTDMKGAVAAMSAILIKLAKDKIQLDGKVTLVFVADEEFSNLGMRNFLQKKRTAYMAVIGEPTELQLAVAHRGVLRDYIDIIARPYHAALPERESNAVNNAAEAMLSLFRLNETLKSYHHEILPPPSIAVTKIEGYENDNIVPGNVRLLTDFRILPGMNFEECRKLEESILKNVGKYEITKHFFMPGGEIDLQHEVVKRCCQIGEKVLHRKQRPVAFDASCEQCFLVEHGIPTVICGPGSLNQAHIVDEYIEKEQVLLSEEYYMNIVKEFLIGSENETIEGSK